MESTSHSMSAANVDSLSGYPSRLIRGKKDDHVSDIVGSADSAQRNCRQDLALEFWRDPPGLHRSERYYVDVNSELAQLGCGAPYVTSDGKRSAPAVLTFTMRPHRAPRAICLRANSPIIRPAARVFTANTRSKAAAVMLPGRSVHSSTSLLLSSAPGGTNVSAAQHAALFTRTSTGPSRCSVCSKSCGIRLASARSLSHACASAPVLQSARPVSLHRPWSAGSSRTTHPVS
jgi:hypothetical protein